MTWVLNNKRITPYEIAGALDFSNDKQFHILKNNVRNVECYLKAYLKHGVE